MGRVLFWLLWPLVWIYSPLVRRVRIIVRVGDQILLVKNRFGAGYWQLPGGGIKLGESVTAAAVRELREETAIEAQEKNLTILSENIVTVKQFGLLLRYHFVELTLKDEPAIEISNELLSYEWAEISTIDEYRIAKEVTTGLKLS